MWIGLHVSRALFTLQTKIFGYENKYMMMFDGSVIVLNSARQFNTFMINL